MLAISSGGLVSSTVAHVGYHAIGSVTVSGASTFTNTNTLYVGEQSQGTVMVQSGGTLNSATTNLGSSTGSNGTVTVTGSGSNWSNTGSVYVGGTSGAAGTKGTLNINSSGTVTVGSTLRTWSQGTVNLTNGKLKTAALNISQGTFSMTGGQLVATTITGNLTRAGGTLTPGDTAVAGLTTVSGTYTQQSGATLAIELGGTATSQFDRLSIGGTASLAGTLTVSLISGFVPAAGNSFQILSSIGRSGTFATQNLPTLTNSDLEWLVNYGPTLGATSLLLSVGLKGDYNRNGVVDAVDYVAWRKSGGTPAQYDVWRSHFGVSSLEQNGSGSSIATPSAVPEPSALALFAVAAMPLLTSGRRRRRHS